MQKTINPDTGKLTVELDDGTVLMLGHIRRFPAEIQRQVSLIKGQWPSNDDIYSICDGDEPGVKRHFGGNIEMRSDSTIWVTVYID